MQVPFVFIISYISQMSDRKYRQKGYQDEDRNRGGSRSGRAPETADGPRGRGLGAPTEGVVKCARCGVRVSAIARPDQTCAGCGSDLHTCSNCRHFDPSAVNECRRPIEARIASKSKRNRCDEFESKVIQQHGSDTRGGVRDAKAAFDDLFDF